MLFAVDYNDNRVHIDETHSNQEYYCPYCGSPLITKKGEVRQHHFAHKSTHHCSDSWVGNRSRNYDISHWHNEWQSLFPKDNQEVMLALGDTKHRADVMIDSTVIEFQHSIMSANAFDDRNNFYFNFGNKVIWLFDLSDLLESQQLTYTKTENGLDFVWNNPKRAFNSYDVKSGCIDLFFQFGEEDKCIVRVMDVSEDGFERFQTTDFITKSEFLEYVGLENGQCLPPCRDDITSNQEYCDFKEKYNINLNQQQERALLAVEGSILLLAVPGSGKTTVLISRLGHMVINKKIAPESLLATTYSNQAADEMRERFSDKFGKDIGMRINFRTINSLSLKIYMDYCRKKREQSKQLIQDKDRKALIGRLYKKHTDEYATESDIHMLSTAIECIKNMMLSDKQIMEFEAEIPKLSAMYADYQKYLSDNMLMDFDDQMVFAYDILMSDSSLLSEYRNRYKYISVDEAQDTSKIQHAIIKLLAEGNNIFMVGDEDQSIYGFRGAYPRALLNFRYDYKNPYILRMEKNYRSTAQIVDKAQAFISKNKGRYEKNMTAERGEGSEVKLIEVSAKEEQYNYLLTVAKDATSETAFLYRDNESAVVLVDLLTRNNIPFNHRKAELNFFGNKVVKDIVAYLTLTVDVFNVDAFSQICNKGIIYLKQQQKEYAIKSCKNRHISVFEAVREQMKYVEYKYRDRADIFADVISRVASVSSYDAINIILNEGYSSYIEGNHLDTNKIDILMMLARQEPDITKFLSRLKVLEKLMCETSFGDSSHIVLSTIHTSKGLEYDTVYMVDVYDGRFPSSRPNVFSRSKDNADPEQEERRLFYVGITRAKNNLYLFAINTNTSRYISEVFLEYLEAKRLKAIEEHRRMLEAEKLKRQKNAEDQAHRREEAIRIFKEQRRGIDARDVEPKDKVIQTAKSNVGYVDALSYDKYGYNPYGSYQSDSDSSPRINSSSNSSDKKTENKLDQISLFATSRRIRCTICGQEGTSADFWFYQGFKGECYKCKK